MRELYSSAEGHAVLTKVKSKALLSSQEHPECGRQGERSPWLEYSLTIVSPSLSGSLQEWSCLCSDKSDPLTGHTKAYSRQKDKQEVVRVMIC